MDNMHAGILALHLTEAMQMKRETTAHVAATPPSQWVPATPRRRGHRAHQTVSRFFSRDEGVAPTFCDGASQLQVPAVVRTGKIT